MTFDEPFLTPPDQAYVKMGVKAPGQGWYAFDVLMPQAREGRASRFVMAVWNSTGDQLSPARSPGEPSTPGHPQSQWYKVPRRVPGKSDLKRTSLWNAIAVAQEHGVPMRAMLKDTETRRCSLSNVFEISEVHYEPDGSALWLRLDPISDSNQPAAEQTIVASVLAPANPVADVDVTVRTFSELFASDSWPVALDTYQRGFVWSKDKVRQLADDLLAYQALPDPKPPYYMGTILLHAHADRQHRYVIDGQQRLTALCVLHQHLRSTLPPNCGLSFSPRSAANIQAAAQEFAAAAAGLRADVLDRITFTAIRVTRADLAFTFFDTQNNRGVQLHATDLLKAYHLRAIDLESPVLTEQVQSDCAHRWERLQQGGQVLSHPQERVKVLFDRFLWRARRWSGVHTHESGHDALLLEFQGPNWAQPGPGGQRSIPLYQARSNRRGSALSLRPGGHCELHLQPVSLSPDAADLPFSIRQPIQRGTGFFLFADKYATLLGRLTQEASTDPEILGFRAVLRTMVAANSLFLQEAFLLASLMFADQFGSDRLWSFSLWLEHSLGDVRLRKQQVRQETAQKFFREDARMNVLDVIAGAFHPEQVIAHLRTMPATSYSGDPAETVKGGVHATYKRAVLKYFGRAPSESLDAKASWIAEQLEMVKA
ncbi:DUF262 domain-containing protein [Variovorax saccharolyticus]|uniref:DUF262 domain-containing protein n=1 Tax=Variovorax saccharolyticus TaxID=3053516 RepID=UPI002576B548|nr:DUF262 domain-containing protein [Variovorax sp. J31P216]MDM0029594.1 DUF262 domain-containing protein [Variovorax sp. J31P216]